MINPEFDHKVSFYMTGFCLNRLIDSLKEHYEKFPDDVIDGVFVTEFIHVPMSPDDQYDEQVDLVFYPASEFQESCDYWNERIDFNDISFRGDNKS